MVEGFEADNLGTRIKAMKCDAGSDNLMPVWKSRMADAHAPDAAFVIGDSLSDLITANLLEPLDDLMQTSSYSSVNSWPSIVMNSAIEVITNKR